MLARLIGRDRETADVRDLLLDPTSRLITLIGPGGAGKTALALTIATRGEPRLDSEIAVVELAPVLEPELVLDAVCHALDVQDAGTRGLGESLATHLQDRQVLIVLDNCEHVLAAAAETVERLLCCPNVRILATSREALRLQNEVVYPLSPLALPELVDGASLIELRASPAVELFLERARQVQATFALDEVEARAVADICVALDGLPLAIELAAARVRVLSPRAIRARLSDRLNLLTTDRPGRAQPPANAPGDAFVELQATGGTRASGFAALRRLRWRLYAGVRGDGVRRRGGRAGYAHRARRQELATRGRPSRMASLAFACWRPCATMPSSNFATAANGKQRKIVARSGLCNWRRRPPRG